MQKTYKIVISGQVQGVGFRPYVYTLAKDYNLTGTVSNNEKGVIIYVTGAEKATREFYKKLIDIPPVASRIDQHALKEIDPREFLDFQIIPSETSAKLNLQLTPDFAICSDCKRELSDTANRRFRYSFTTCVNCGPRWSITKTFPFERAHTSISEFKMCDACEDEYTNPSNRRFHSQTNSCATCGIGLRFVTSEGTPVPIQNSEVYHRISEFLTEGNIIAIKNTGGYLLCCDATNADAIQKLRSKKRRPTKPFAILYPSLEFLKKELVISAENEKLLTSPESPIVILKSSNHNGNLALEAIAPGLNQLGIMLPYTAILQLLATALSMPIVATSGNMHGSPILSSEEEATAELRGIADYFLHHDLNVLNAQDDSVVKVSHKRGQQVFFRRSRGYAPNYYGSISSTKKVMAMGGHLKSTIAFLPNDYLYLSQYLGNLDNYDVYRRFLATSSNFIELFQQPPEVILTDGHPAYQSTVYGKELAQQLGADLCKIQHHKAHFTSVLGEHELFESSTPVLGVIWDGTGYGDDAMIWGGDFFAYQDHRIERVSHFDYYDWMAGDKMAKEPRLSLFSLSDEEMLEAIKGRFTSEELVVFKKMKVRNQLKTSSVGRIFDAVASLLDICHVNTYEGEAAILLENFNDSYDIDNCTAYCSITENGTIPSYLLLKNIYLDLKEGNSREAIILNFLYTLASLILEVAARYKLRNIACSGGVFQNTILIDMLQEKAGADFQLYFNRNLSPNDENISFGQMMYYLHINN